MSFFGGGTDMKEYFSENKGAVLSTTFDKYCYVIVRRLPEFFDYTTELSYSKIERVNNLEEIKHPAIRNAMQYYGMNNIRLSYEADLPARSGLGTSSSFAVGMLNAFHVLKGEEVSKRDLAEEAIHLERVLCQESGGWQDQIAAAFGGFNRIDFSGDDFTVTPVRISESRKEQLNNNLMLFFTGFTRFSSDIQDTNRCFDKKKTLGDMYSLVNEAESILTNDNVSLDEFGRLLHETWCLKRGTGNKISTESIDFLYNKGLEAGALGGKLLGAGGGGFLLFYVPEDKREEVKKAIGIVHIPFSFEDKGTRLLYNRGK